MFWNACSTFEASRAEVSMKERLFSAGRAQRHRKKEMSEGKERERETGQYKCSLKSWGKGIGRPEFGSVG